MFNPSDTRLIDDAPSERRKMLNIEISQIYKEYLVVLTNYQRILKHRETFILEECILMEVIQVNI